MRRTALASFVAASLWASSASARSTAEYTYPYDQLWRAAVRLIAVDLRYPISERDPEIGYLLFDYREGGRAYPGSVELVRTRAESGAETVRVVISIESMPSYVERVVLDRLHRKLYDDYGAPPRTRPAPPPAPPVEEPDEDAPSDDDEAPREREDADRDE